MNEVFLTHAVSMGQVNQDVLKFNCAHQYLVYSAYLNIFKRRFHTTRNITVVFLVASKLFSLEVNADVTKYMVMSRD
jgi:hypothetical protein